jgi:predicted transcriptional regulator
VIDDPLAVVDATIAHRLAREAQVLEVLRERGPTTITDLVEQIYADVLPELHPVARRTVWAHLRKLADEGAAKGDDLDGEWSAT